MRKRKDYLSILISFLRFRLFLSLLVHLVVNFIVGKGARIFFQCLFPLFLDLKKEAIDTKLSKRGVSLSMDRRVIKVWIWEASIQILLLMKI